jgi:dipeptidyl aminopeptidase/acylaminoacyl peptidase
MWNKCSTYRSSVECGWEFNEIGPRSTEELVEMRRKSPLWHARSVKAPTLLLVGSGDLRVPAAQSLLYYHQLKAQGTSVK